MEHLLIPFQAAKHIVGNHVLVLAPHPDDEVFGCGGAIMRHVVQQIPVQVIIVTDGSHSHNPSEEEKSNIILQRQQESIAAAKILGYGEPIFWQYQDRELAYGEKLIADIRTAILDTEADLVYAPSVYEIHPDHRTLGMAAIEAVRRSDRSIQLALYEIGQPIRPNLLLDISDLETRKMEAMGCFVSQNTKQRYDLDIAALNRYRTYTLPAEVTAAEAYLLTDSNALADDPLNLYQSEHTRQQKSGLPIDTQDLPLISVIIRSMDRPTLSDALDSVALQTYPNIEVVVVNAKGPEHQKPGSWCGRFPLHFTNNTEPLERSKAANLGLETAKGKYLIFLDDDDLFYPEHIGNLVSALQDHNSFQCAYSGVRIDYYVDDQFKTSTKFNEPYDQHKLWGRNFIPIHAMLFEKTLIDAGCNFDEKLDFFEDWDFWLQISQQTPILHVDTISAVYNNYGRSGLGLEQDNQHIRALRGKLFNKWKPILSGEQLDDLIEYREKTITDLRNNHIDLQHQLNKAHNQLTETHEQFAHTQKQNQKQFDLQLTNKQQQIDTLLNQFNRLKHDLHTVHTREIALQKTINDLTQSTSWKISAPMRFVSRLLRGQYREAWDGLRRRLKPFLLIIYWRLPGRWRDKLLTLAYRCAGPFFSGSGHYETWLTGKKNASYHLPETASGFLAKMVDISKHVPLSSEPVGRIAIHAHIFYPDLAAEFAKFLSNMPYTYDLFVSISDENARHHCKRHFSRLPQLNQLVIEIAPNRGRDIAPMFCTFGDVLSEYEFIAHIHTKKSLYNNGATDGWREYLLSNLLGNKTQIRKIFNLLTDKNNIGIIYPQNFIKLPYSAYTWLSNKPLGHIWCRKLGISPIPDGYFDFPAGSMFWAKTEALQPLFTAGIKIEDFPKEAGQNDETLAHCLERLLVLVTKRSGFNAAILRDTESNSWSRWRFEQYLAQKPANIQSMSSDVAIQIVAFDIFDTLLTRPLLNPEKIKTLIAHRAGGETGKVYLELRAAAESQARQKAGKDIGLDEIFKELATLSGLSSDAIDTLRHLEEIVEKHIVKPRKEIVELFYTAITLGKRIVLVSDMYLPKATIETMLEANGITGWHQLYLSSDIGLRKDTGELYRHLLSTEQVSPDTVMLVGDNEHSDIQIPGNMGMKILHVLRPIELARSIPRFGPIVEKSVYQDDLNMQLTLGSIVQANFQPLSFPHFDPTDFVPASPKSIGFSIAGPLILSFIQWLIKKSKTDHITHLFFLSREGRILKTVYDRWTSNTTDAIQSDYLVLSRRLIAVSMISTRDDIYEIASKQFSPNQLSTYLQERFGIVLSTEEYNELIRKNLWQKNKLVSVEQQNIDHLKPLLHALEDKIYAQAQKESPGLMAYLNKMKLSSIDSAAVIDVGYAATIQGRLNRLLNKPIHGYYLVTDERAEKISNTYNIKTQGCFGHFVNAFHNPPQIFIESFSMEKLLSSDEAQIIRYHLEDTNNVIPEYRQLTEIEQQTATTRAELQRGIMDFVDHCITIRDELHGDFIIPTELARELFETFIEQPSKTELRILEKLILDDYYCGRGLVS